MRVHTHAHTHMRARMRTCASTRGTSTSLGRCWAPSICASSCSGCSSHTCKQGRCVCVSERGARQLQ